MKKNGQECRFVKVSRTKVFFFKEKPITSVLEGKK